MIETAKNEIHYIKSNNGAITIEKLDNELKGNFFILESVITGKECSFDMICNNVKKYFVIRSNNLDSMIDFLGQNYSSFQLILKSLVLNNKIKIVEKLF